MKYFLALCVLLCMYNKSTRAQAPTVASGNVSFSQIDGDRYAFAWANGNGARRIVVMRENAPVTAVPVNGVDYNHNAVFGTGDAILPGQYVVYDNSGGPSAAVTALLPNTTYHLAIFEYNGAAASTQYLTSAFGAGSQATLSSPSVQASGFVFSNVTGNSLSVAWTNGNGQRRMLVARAGAAVNVNPVDLTAYSSNTTFGNGSQLGAGNFVIYNSTAAATSVTALQPNTIYHFALFEFNGLNGPLYLIPGATGSVTTTQRPSVPATNVSFSSIDGGQFNCAWTNGNGTRRIVVARAGSPVTAVPLDGTDYVANSVFGSGDAIAPGQFVLFDNSFSNAAISNLSPATTYYFRIYEYDGTGTNAAYLTSSYAEASQATSAAPTIQAGNITFNTVTGNSVTCNWANGNGQRRLVLMRALAAVNFVPADLSFYNTNAAFGTGTQLGTGNYSIYSSNGSSVSITALQPNTTYHVAVYEYNGSNMPVYLQPAATGSFTTSAQPTIPSGAMNFFSVDGDRMSLSWTPGNGSRRILVGRAGNAVTGIPVDGTDYTASSVFGSGNAIAPGEFVLYDNAGGQGGVTITGLQPNTTYHFRIYEYNGAGITTSYLTSLFTSGNRSTLSSPATPASAISFTNVAGSSFRINWTNGSGNGRMVLVKQGSAVDAMPTDLLTYSGNAIFGSGSQLGTGNYVVYYSSGSSVLVTNLIPNTTYHVAIFEYNGANSPVYHPSPSASSSTTGPHPTVPSSNLTAFSTDGDRFGLSWSVGNGTRRILVARAGSPVTALPVNGADYTANTSFGSGDAIQPGQFVLYNSIGGPGGVVINNLQPGTVYHFAVFEYDGAGAATVYLTSVFPSISHSTLAAPTLQTSNISFSSIAGTSVSVNWTNGNGAGRMIVARQGSPVNSNPTDLATYSANTIFGAGSQIGAGNFVIANSSATSTNVTALTSGTTYHFAIFEYNGTNGRVYLVPGTTGSVTTLGAPQVPASTVTASVVTTTTLQLTWTNGSGNRRLILMKSGSAVDANPIDNGNYIPNSSFGAGTQAGTANYVVYNATGNTMTVTGLVPSTTYHFAVFEFNAFGASSQFLLANPARGSAFTAGTLPLTWLDFTASNQQNAIVLKWSTSTEVNSAHFELERNAHNNDRDFISLGTVMASGNSNSPQHYSFKDDQAQAGIQYYRIKQYDKDNRFTYSKIISISYQPAGLIRRYLNPVHNTLFVSLTGFDPAQQSRNEWRLYNMAGIVVARETITGATIYGQLPHLPAGLYLLQVNVNNKTDMLKIIKQ